MMGKNILIVDDDPHILEVVEFALAKADMQTGRAQDGREALEQFVSGTFDLVVLDISMPEMDGLEVCRQIRKTSEVPIVFLSSRDEEIDRILGLEIGGDDYVTKPFSPRELVARIRAILKRTAPLPQKGQGGLLSGVEQTAEQEGRANGTQVKTLQWGAVLMDRERFHVSWNNQEIVLTATEFSILGVFLSSPRRVFDRATLVTQGYDVNIHVSDRTVDSHIRHIRAKFLEKGCEKIIETVHGVGYRLADCEA